MGLLIHGVNKATIGIDEFLVKCPACEADNFADVLVTSNYYHMYYIPIFPFEKEVTLVCQNCGLKRYNVPFVPQLFKNYYEIKNKFKHPWYTYLFIGFVSFLILTAIVFSV
jgi:C4-type Zn-finger protein